MKRPENWPPEWHRLPVLGFAQAAAYCAMSETRLRELVAEGRITVAHQSGARVADFHEKVLTKRGQREVVVPRRDLDRLIASWQRYGGEAR